MSLSKHLRFKHDDEIGFAEKVDLLSRSSAYPHDAADLEIVETHMSTVFLVGAYAYKLKKPVRYDFLDFSTREVRLKDCRAEVELNRKLAPGIYLGVVPLSLKAGGNLELGGSGEPVDWLVKMRRLPVKRTLKYQIEHKLVEQSELKALARRMAEFYLQAPRQSIEPGAYLEHLTNQMLLNQRLLASSRFGMPKEQVNHLNSVQSVFLRQEDALFAQRIEDGRIVESHGDMRPEHIYLGANPIIVDCLEFNRTLRILDPVDELSFLAMECAFLGDADVGNLILREVITLTEDKFPDELVWFYACCRVCLRARLSLLHLDEQGVENADQWLHKAQVYLDLGTDYALKLERRLG